MCSVVVGTFGTKGLRNYSPLGVAGNYAYVAGDNCVLEYAELYRRKIVFRADFSFYDMLIL